MIGKKRSVRLITNIVLAGLILAVFYFALNSSLAHRYYFSLIEQRVGWKISADKISINPFLASVRIRGVNILSPTNRQLIAGGYIYVRISPLSLFRGKIIASRLEVGDIYLSFEQSKTPQKIDRPPRFNIPYIANLAKKIAGNFALQNIEVVSGDIGPLKIKVLKRNGKVVDLDLDHFQFELRQTIWRRNDFHFTARQLWVNKKVIASYVEAQADVSGHRVVLKPLKMLRPEGSYQLNADVQVREKTIGGDITLRVEIPAAFQKPIYGEGVINLRPPNLIIEPLKLNVGEMKATARAQMRLPNMDYQVAVQMAETSLEPVWAAFRLPSLTSLEGVASLKGELKGRIPELKAEAELTAQPLSYEPFQFSQVLINVVMDWPNISWEARAPAVDTPAVISSGTLLIQTDPTEPKIQDLMVEFKDAKLASLLPDEQVDGQLSGRVEVHRKREGLSGAGQLSVTKGHIGKQIIDRIDADFEFLGNKMRVSRLALQIPASPEIVTKAPLDIVFGSERITMEGQPVPGLELVGHYQKQAKLWRLESLRYESAGDVFTASGQYQHNGNFSLKMNGALDASALRPLRFLFNDVGGTIQTDVIASGTLKRPQVSGEIGFQRVMMDLRGLGDPIQDLNGTVRIQHNKVTLDHIEGLHGDGRFKADGSVRIDGLNLKAFNVALKGNDLTFRFHGAMNVDFDADFKIEGALPSPLVTGKVELIAGRYYKKFILTRAVFDERYEDQIRVEPETDFFNDWRWDVQVRNSGDLRIDNNIANVFLDGDMRLRGTTKRPVISGVVTTTSGELHYLGHDMEITEGSLEFNDPNRVNPILKMIAQEEIAASEDRGIRSFYTVNVKLEGPLDNLQTTLWSSPPVDQSDVVSLLAFGLTQSQLREQGSARRAFATSLVANSLTSGFGESLADSVGLDVLRFESGEGSAQAISGVALGKNLSDRLSVEFYTDITPETAQRRVRSKYFLTDNIFLEGANTFEEDRTKFELNISLQFQIR